MNTNLKIDNIKDLKILHLTPDQIQYKDFIGKIVLEKSPFTKTVLYDKEIQTPEPSFWNSFLLKKYELLAGETNTEIEIVNSKERILKPRMKDHVSTRLIY
jgi:hypothetical protein